MNEKRLHLEKEDFQLFLVDNNADKKMENKSNETISFRSPPYNLQLVVQYSVDFIVVRMFVRNA